MYAIIGIIQIIYTTGLFSKISQANINNRKYYVLFQIMKYESGVQ